MDQLAMENKWILIGQLEGESIRENQMEKRKVPSSVESLIVKESETSL